MEPRTPGADVRASSTVDRAGSRATGTTATTIQTEDVNITAANSQKFFKTDAVLAQKNWGRNYAG